MRTNGTRAHTTTFQSCFLAVAWVGVRQLHKQDSVTSQENHQKVAGESPLLHIFFKTSPLLVCSLRYNWYIIVMGSKQSFEWTKLVFCIAWCGSVASTLQCELHLLLATFFCRHTAPVDFCEAHHPFRAVMLPCTTYAALCLTHCQFWLNSRWQNFPLHAVLFWRLKFWCSISRAKKPLVDCLSEQWLVGVVLGSGVITGVAVSTILVV